MATATLQSFNVFLTDRLTAAAVDIYGFVERAILDYQEEVNKARQENQRLQRLLDLVYQPEIRLHREDSRQIDLPTPTQEVSAQEQHIKKESVPSVAGEDPAVPAVKEEQAEPWTGSVETPVAPESRGLTDDRTRAVTAGQTTEHDDAPSQEGDASCRAAATHTKRKNLASHVATHSTASLDRITCPVCGKATETRSRLIRHLRAHSDYKPFACAVCGNKYKLKGHLKEHARTHTGERPYTCYICGKAFNRSTTMSKHAKVQHMEYLPYKCLQCSQRFPLLVTFKQHMKAAHETTVSV